MRTFAIRLLASTLAGLLSTSCGVARESRQPETGEIVFLSRAPRAVLSPAVDELELRKAVEELLPYVNVEEARAELRRMVTDPRFHGRQPGELRVVLTTWGSGPAALEEIGREYRAFCAAVRRTNCHQGPLTASSIYEIAFDFAMGSQWDGFVGEVKSTVDPSTIRIVLLTGLVIFMATIAIPELLSKIPAAAATVVLTAYLGAQAVCDLVFGWIQMVRELDAATTFSEVRAAGERYGRLVGAQTARILILLATAAIARGGLVARLMKLPRATQASAALAAETSGVGLEAVGAVKGVRVLQGGMAMTLPGVAMASHGPVPGIGPGSMGHGSTEERGGSGTQPAKGTSGTGQVAPSLEPEKGYLGHKKHGIRWTEGAAEAKKTGIPQGQWGSVSDLEFAGQKAATLPPRQGGYFELPAGHSSTVWRPDGTQVRASRIWVRNNGGGTFHGYPLE
ncbi:MAG TPA: hypothetical protein VFB61_01770 [Gemmatimonadales bacterium]|nr:hypothetical protein [Gemmatimonadales bacterium]